MTVYRFRSGKSMVHPQSGMAVMPDPDDVFDAGDLLVQTYPAAFVDADEPADDEEPGDES